MKNNEFAKKTKIVATIGPATDGEKNLTALVRAGMSVARLNFSHGDFAEHGARFDVIRNVSKKTGKPIAILQDLAGPKIRIGDFYKDRVVLKKGSVFTLNTKHVIGDETKAFVNYSKLPQEVTKGQVILLDDGKRKFVVMSTTKTEVKCKILVGGEVKGRRGVNIPGANLKISAITAKDKKDLAFGISKKVDFVGLSFVRDAKDIKQLRAMLVAGKLDAGIIAKIETQEAIDNIDDILECTDGIMVARGDLAVEVGAHNVPVLQKMIIEKCNRLGKPVVTATQMLESMINSPVPTRAEVSDVANSIFDGTDAVMLSEETALGQYPVEAVSMMSDIAIRIEEERIKRSLIREDADTVSTVDAITGSVVKTADKIHAKAIIALTESGSTAVMVTRHKPIQPVIAMSPIERTRAKLALSFGCYPVTIKGFKFVMEVRNEVSKFVIKNKVAKKGDRVVIVAGVPFGESGGTNMLMVHTV